MAESRITGDVLHENVIYKEILWMIDTDLFPEENMISSPSFKVSGADCKFSLYPNGTEKYHGMFAINLFIPLWNSSEMYCDITVCTKENGTNVNGIRKERPSKDNIFFGFKKSSLFTKGTNVCSLRNLTIFCLLKIKKNAEFTALESEQTLLEHGLENTYNSQNGKRFHIETLIHDLNELHVTENHSDVTIKVKTEEFRAHRIILGARTPVFTSMFEHDMSEKTTGIVILDDCEPVVFKAFLTYVYTGELGCQPENACGLYKMADKYQMNELKSECLKYIKSNFSADTFCDALSIALVHSEKELLKLATAYFCKNTRAILVTIKWQKFLEDNPTYANELFLKLVP